VLNGFLHAQAWNVFNGRATGLIRSMGPCISAGNSASRLPFTIRGGSRAMEERRNTRVRSEITRRIVTSVIQNPSVTLSVDTLHTWLGLQMEAADRILQRLASSGIVREVQRGVWARGNWPGSQRDWY
jgi:hypothetical protein